MVLSETSERLWIKLGARTFDSAFDPLHRADAARSETLERALLNFDTALPGDEAVLLGVQSPLCLSLPIRITCYESWSNPICVV